MKLQQLRYLLEIEKQQLNISRAAQVLHTSQSGISKQMQLLEQELGVELFVRGGRNLLAMTPAAHAILPLARQALSKTTDIKALAKEYASQPPTLSIATTHTQARYVLPKVVERFLSLYPETQIQIHQGTPLQIATMVERDEVDLAIASEVLIERDTLVALPCYRWSRSIITPLGHPLTQALSLSLEDLVTYPIITYDLGFTGRRRLDDTFAAHQLRPNFVLTAVDADVIKTYVRLGMGIGIIANMAFNPELDRDLAVLDAEALFGISESQLAVKKGKYIKRCVLQFIDLLAPHLAPDIVEQALHCQDVTQQAKLFANIAVPKHSLLIKALA